MPTSPATAPQAQWQAAVLKYASAINQYVQDGQQHGWDGLKEPETPEIEHLLPAWRAALDARNRQPADAAQHQAFRQEWPPAHQPLASLLDKEGQMIPALALLDDGSLLARIGSAYEGGQVVRIDGERVEPVTQGDFFGRCPQRRFFAWSSASGIRVTDGWNGPQVSEFPWPTGREGLPEGVPVDEEDGDPLPSALIPFPDGQRVLLVSGDGIFVLHAEGATRLLRRPQDIAQDLADGVDPDDLAIGLCMAHGAISPDGQWIAVGDQCSHHLVFNAELALAAQIGPVGEYPHFALFNQQGDQLILNACHFYNGSTLGVAVADLPGLSTDFYSDDPRTPVLQDGARVYAGTSRGDEFIVGDAYGYLRAFSSTGEERWQHYVGSSFSAMDISADGRTLAVSTYAGIISLIRLEDGRPDWQIGTGEHREERRWLFWKSFAKPLAW